MQHSVRRRSANLLPSWDINYSKVERYAHLPTEAPPGTSICSLLATYFPALHESLLVHSCHRGARCVSSRFLHSGMAIEIAIPGR